MDTGVRRAGISSLMRSLDCDGTFVWFFERDLGIAFSLFSFY